MPPAATPSITRRTRIKICGLTREQDVDAAVQAGADAVGFVLYDRSPRYVPPERAAQLAARLPAFVTPVLLFVNEDAAKIIAACARIHWALVQFHGDETVAECLQIHRPFMRAARVPMHLSPDFHHAFDLVKFSQDYAAAQAILVDAYTEGYGGGGHPFNWNAINWSHPQLNASTRLVLSGGLTPANVADGIAQVRPWAVDVSSGVEAVNAQGVAQKGIKDPEKIIQFVAAVRRADELLANS